MLVLLFYNHPQKGPDSYVETPIWFLKWISDPFQVGTFGRSGTPFQVGLKGLEGPLILTSHMGLCKQTGKPQKATAFILAPLLTNPNKVPSKDFLWLRYFLALV